MAQGPDLAADASLDVSVVVPVFYNAATVEELYRRTVHVLEEKGLSFEIIFVDDGSRDNSWEILRSLRKDDERVRLLRLSRNFGQHAALCAGIERIRGKIYITIDADLQNFPEDIPALIDEVEKGSEFVSGYRVNRQDPFFARLIPSRLLNWIVHAMTGIKLRDYGCGLNASRRRLAADIRHYGEMRRFLKPLHLSIAETVSEVPVRHARREGERSRYNFTSLVGLQFDFFTSFTRKPFQVIGLVGILLFLAGVLGAGVYLALRVGGEIPPGNRLQVALLVSMLLGIQLAVLGLLGEFIVRIFQLTQGQPFYVVRDEED